MPEFVAVLILDGVDPDLGVIISPSGHGEIESVESLLTLSEVAGRTSANGSMNFLHEMVMVPGRPVERR